MKKPYIFNPSILLVVLLLFSACASGQQRQDSSSVNVEILFDSGKSNGERFLFIDRNQKDNYFTIVALEKNQKSFILQDVYGEYKKGELNIIDATGFSKKNDYFPMKKGRKILFYEYNSSRSELNVYDSSISEDKQKSLKLFKGKAGELKYSGIVGNNDNKFIAAQKSKRGLEVKVVSLPISKNNVDFKIKSLPPDLKIRSIFLDTLIHIVGYEKDSNLKDQYGYGLSYDFTRKKKKVEFNFGDLETQNELHYFDFSDKKIIAIGKMDDKLAVSVINKNKPSIRYTNLFSRIADIMFIEKRITEKENSYIFAAYLEQGRLQILSVNYSK